MKRRSLSLFNPRSGSDGSSVPRFHSLRDRKPEICLLLRRNTLPCTQPNRCRIGATMHIAGCLYQSRGNIRPQVRLCRQI